MKIKVNLDGKTTAEVEGSPEVIAALLRGVADELAGRVDCKCYHYHYQHTPHYGYYGGTGITFGQPTTITSASGLSGDLAS